MSNHRDFFTKARDDEMLALYPSVPTCELAEMFRLPESTIRSLAKRYGVEKAPGCPRKYGGKPAVKRDPDAAPRELQIPDSAVKSPTSHGIQGVIAVDGWRVITHKIR